MGSESELRQLCNVRSEAVEAFHRAMERSPSQREMDDLCAAMMEEWQRTPRGSIKITPEMVSRHCPPDPTSTDRPANTEGAGTRASLAVG